LIEICKKRKLEKLIGNYISTITLLEFLRYFKESAKRREMKRLLEEIFEIVNTVKSIKNLKKKENSSEMQTCL